MFAFTSMGGKIDHLVNQGKGPYVFRLHDQNMHLLGSLIPCDGERSKFSQLYIYDTNIEVSNRARSVSSSRSEGQYDASLILQICQLLDSCNPLVMQYRTVKVQCRSSNANNLKFKLTRKRQFDARTYNLTTASEVAALIVGDFDMEKGERDSIVENRSGFLQRIDELHPLYLPMQYPLLFPYGEDGYQEDILFRDGSISNSRKQRYLTLRQYIAYKFHDRRREFNMIFKAEKLTHQFIVDAFMIIEAQRTSYIKLNRLMRDIIKDMLFETRKAAIYTIEFQKHGLPHAHILLWMAPKDKFTLAAQIDSVIFAEVPNPYAHPELRTLMWSSTIRHDQSNTSLSMSAKDMTKSYSIMQSEILRRELAVECLPFHLPNRQGIVFAVDDPIDNVVGNASLKQTKFLAWLEANGTHATARELTYAQFPTKFLFKTNTHEWCPRKASYVIGRLYYVPPRLGKLHYLRVLLTFVRGPTSYEDIRNEKQLDDDRVKDIALAEIEKILRSNGRSLRDFPPMSLPDDALMSNTNNALMSEELNYDRNILRTQHSQFVSSLTIEQRNVYDSIIDVVYRSEGGLILGGRTAHSRFAIPLDCNKNSTCNIMQGNDLANLMVHTKLIIWDEAPMAHRYCFEALDKSHRGNSDSENRSICEFADWILQIGVGLIGDMVNDEESEIIVPDDILISNVHNPVEAIVENTYPSFQQKCDDHECIRDRAIPAPTLDDVAVINNYMLLLLPGEESIYLSSNIICSQD
ncbi:uncharacterized protein G2W53_018044 [Senna tora]|uniref:ATP-dependent DNA helicase n=1 Tax=Senna tora TaxID=362788 RepID=A0A834WKQ3_9FABA|nr:uncharacterized protein G2W53_018044 [Senna tora]